MKLEESSGSFNNIGITTVDLEPLQIRKGGIIGTEDTLSQLGNKTVKTYLGIPYAEPPVKELRFKAPEDIRSWTVTLKANKLPKSCPQVIETSEESKLGTVNEISEDCLYLNVFVPSELDLLKIHAVMVWIHGGGFMRGSSTLELYDARFLAAVTGTIVVSMNYRLGAFGFLNLEGSDKNVGMLDQVMAFEWVRDNIHYFGGNPDKVTLFGESAGAASVSMHLLSPLSKGLFHQAILQSGTAINPWSYVPSNESLRRSKVLATTLHCNTGSDEDVLKCMQDMSMENIINNQEKVNPVFLQFSFVPAIDGKFMKKTPEEILKEGCFEKIPILAGSNKDEATFFMAFVPFLQEADALTTENKLNFAFDNLFSYYPKTPNPLNINFINDIRAQYSPEEAHRTTPAYNFDALNRAFTDSSFICPMNNFMSAYAERDSHVYSYYFTQLLNHQFVPPQLGVTHASELFFTFSFILKYGMKAGFTEEQINFSKKLNQMWGNFVKRG